MEDLYCSSDARKGFAYAIMSTLDSDAKEKKGYVSLHCLIHLYNWLVNVGSGEFGYFQPISDGKMKNKKLYLVRKAKKVQSLLQIY